MILYHTIVANGLKSGFEISTAFGYSSAYISSALKKNGGKLTTMDCYIEEALEDAEYVWDGQYESLIAKTDETRKAAANGTVPHGLRMAKEMAEVLGNSDSVAFQIGVSPQNVGDFLSGKIDFAFIDGGHHGDQPTLDFKAVEPFLAPKCVVFFHDNGAPEIEKAVRECSASLGTEAVLLPTRYQLTLVGRGLDESFLRSVRGLCVRSSFPKRILCKIARRADIFLPL
jgi:predicted O-methyltransferase YrrM